MINISEVSLLSEVLAVTKYIKILAHLCIKLQFPKGSEVKEVFTSDFPLDDFRCTPQLPLEATEIL